MSSPSATAAADNLCVDELCEACLAGDATAVTRFAPAATKRGSGGLWPLHCAALAQSRGAEVAAALISARAALDAPGPEQKQFSLFAKTHQSGSFSCLRPCGAIMSSGQRTTGNSGEAVPASSRRSRVSSPAPKAREGDHAPKTAAKPAEAKKSSATESLPGTFAFESYWAKAGLARGLAAYSPVLSPLSALLSLAAAIYLIIYATKIVLAPSGFRRDISEPATMSAVAGAPATLQLLTLRLHQVSGLLPLAATQSAVLVLHVLQIFCSLRFVFLNISKQLPPDPSWFPGILLYGMTNITSFAVGPAWLQATMSGHFWFTMTLYVPLKLAVLYRLFLSRSRDSVAPHAGMAVLMAPASFYTMAHLSSGKPGGDVMGYVLFADSTVCFLLALSLLCSRRKLWISGFHPTYVAFTFPLASTASAALLASERLPLVAGATCRTWATAVHLAAEHAGGVEVLQVLLAARANPDAQTLARRTPLHFAAVEGVRETIEVLLEARANVNAMNSCGAIPLHWAAKTGQAQLIQLLVEARSDLTVSDNLGRTPVEMAEDNLKGDAAAAIRQAAAL
eukprot:s4748_g2.t1